MGAGRGRRPDGPRRLVHGRLALRSGGTDRAGARPPAPGGRGTGFDRGGLVVDARPRSRGLRGDAGRPGVGTGQPWGERHRRGGVDRPRGGTQPRADHRPGRRPRLPPRRVGSGRTGRRTAPAHGGGGGQRRRGDLLVPPPGGPPSGRALRAPVRHASGERPGGRGPRVRLGGDRDRRRRLVHRPRRSAHAAGGWPGRGGAAARPSGQRRRPRPGQHRHRRGGRRPRIVSCRWVVRRSATGTDSPKAGLSRGWGRRTAPKPWPS